MQISSRFTIAVHMIICIEAFKDTHKVTSEFIASSVNVNPVVIRRLLQQLKKTGIVEVKRGSGGADIARPLDEITLLDVYNAVESLDNGVRERMLSVLVKRVDEGGENFGIGFGNKSMSVF